MISLLSVARRDWVSCVLVLGPLHHHAAKILSNQTQKHREKCETRHLW